MMAVFLLVISPCKLQPFTWPTAFDMQLAEEAALPIGVRKMRTMFWK